MSGNRIPSNHRSVPVDYTNALRERPSDPAFHPPFFAATAANLLIDTFNCHFEVLENDRHKNTPLPEYIDSLVQATKLPFQVTVAALILLQRLYTRLPPHIYQHRDLLSPYQLFTGAYIIAAKQYTQLRLGLDVTQLITHEEKTTFEADGTTVALVMSTAFWSRLTTYSISQLKEMQRQFLNALGGNVCVFPVSSVESQEFLKKLPAFPLRRGLPSSIARRPHLGSMKRGTLRSKGVESFGRMTAEEHLDHFMENGKKYDSLARGVRQSDVLV
ncbi:hypothetical protein D9613_010129 [Agrocybe pediades]|uniref:Uncharacterized protein n=1 Tax=Agrocybe pediades TaxID=84607 RepID=A0A8H4QWE1_9AGAR|nr:hypothetical protein D9613_010129 [Agrocybe pediades]